jgi:hypothetical protein
MRLVNDITSWWYVMIMIKMASHHQKAAVKPTYEMFIWNTCLKGKISLTYRLFFRNSNEIILRLLRMGVEHGLLLSKRNMKLHVFENKVPGKIFGSKKD